MISIGSFEIVLGIIGNYILLKQSFIYKLNADSIPLSGRKRRIIVGNNIKLIEFNINKGKQRTNMQKYKLLKKILLDSIKLYNESQIFWMQCRHCNQYKSKLNTLHVGEAVVKLA